MIRPAQLILAAALVATAATAAAQQPSVSQRVRGTVEAYDGKILTVHARDGRSVAIRLDDAATISAVKALALSDIKPSSFIGTVTMNNKEGKEEAIEVVVFPPSTKASEGIFPWDLQPQSSMVNATVATIAEQPHGRELQVTAKGESRTVIVPPGTPVVTLEPADRALLTPGTPVFVVAAVAADGSLSTTRVTAGKDGVAPPM